MICFFVPFLVHLTIVVSSSVTQTVSPIANMTGIAKAITTISISKISWLCFSLTLSVVMAAISVTQSVPSIANVTGIAEAITTISVVTKTISWLGFSFALGNMNDPSRVGDVSSGSSVSSIDSWNSSRSISGDSYTGAKASDSVSPIEPISISRFSLSFALSNMDNSTGIGHVSA